MQSYLQTHEVNEMCLYKSLQKRIKILDSHASGYVCPLGSTLVKANMQELLTSMVDHQGS